MASDSDDDRSGLSTPEDATRDVAVTPEVDGAAVNGDAEDVNGLDNEDDLFGDGEEVEEAEDAG